MAIDPRRFAIAFSATSAFLHLYAPQATLPLMAQEYGVGAADASKIITAGHAGGRGDRAVYRRAVGCAGAQARHRGGDDAAADPGDDGRRSRRPWTG